MLSEGRPLKPPTERELQLAADWSRTSRLIEESIFLRLDFDPKDIDNPRDRYAPMKWLLNDEYVRYMHLQGDSGCAREYRRQRRAKFAQLLKRLQDELTAAYNERVSDIERDGCWRDYGECARESLHAQLCIVLFNTALLLHKCYLPGPKNLAVLASDFFRYATLSRFTQHRVVPIR